MRLKTKPLPTPDAIRDVLVRAYPNLPLQRITRYQMTTWVVRRGFWNAVAVAHHPTRGVWTEPTVGNTRAEMVWMITLTVLGLVPFALAYFIGFYAKGNAFRKEVDAVLMQEFGPAEIEKQAQKPQ